MLHIGMLPISRAVYLWRIKQGLSQQELAARAGLPRPNLSYIEQGARDVTLSTLRRLAEALGIRPGVLAEGIPPESYQSQVWSRENLDRLAHYFVGQKVRLNAREQKAAKLLQPLFNKAARRGARRADQSFLIAKCLFDPAAFKNLVTRVEKLKSVVS
jgi:transcriptional regulator with XRE-family HTH domain